MIIEFLTETVPVFRWAVLLAILWIISTPFIMVYVAKSLKVFIKPNTSTSQSQNKNYNEPIRPLSGTKATDETSHTSRTQ
jgi:uncharacterized membrane protein